MPKIVTAEEAVKLIKDGVTIYTPGITLGGFAEEVVMAIETSFKETGHPRDLTFYYPSGIGNRATRGYAHLAHEGLIKRSVGGHYKGCGPAWTKLVQANKTEAYCFPQGIMTTMPRNIAARRGGILSKVGLGTFVDPRIGSGGKLNPKTEACEDLVEVVEMEGQEWLYYKVPKLDIAIIRGSVADENGNLSLYREGYSLEQLSVAQAAKASGGIVIAQVEHIVKAGTLHPKEVTVPGIMIDYVVVAQSENHFQTGQTYFSPVYAGDIKVPLGAVPPEPLTERKVIARRADMELFPGAVVNNGVGIPEIAGAVCAEEKINHLFTMTTEAGHVGGVPAGAHDFGCCYNSEAIVAMGHQFDFFNGGMIDVAILGLAQVDGTGNMNVSQVNGEPIGIGGFIDIAQNSKKCVFVGTFTTGGLKVKVEDGKLHIVQEGKAKKFVSAVEQITFSGKYAQQVKQEVLYVTERAVFELTPEGVELIEIAPGIDLEKDILQQMDFKPIIKNPKLMPGGIFQEEPGAVAAVVNAKVKA
ncbi:MAG: acyl CoA:acetate/3-ketoacid CoA transferase [Firmicutes bacterium]|nr:acyl CoA:acetate/3-ketoacid CoA transferase [Bacillota bacterium]